MAEFSEYRARKASLLMEMPFINTRDTPEEITISATK